MAERATVQLLTRSALPSAEILVLDGNYQFVHRAVGSLDIALAPGVYTLQYRAGSAVAEVQVALRPGSAPVTVPAPPLLMKSPAPLAGNKAGDLYGDVARECSSSVHASLGKGGELFVFLRMATADMARARSSDNKLSDVAVLNADGKQIAHLRESQRRAQDGTSVGCNLELDPGTYMLRFDGAESATFEQSFVVSEGWQTQVFASSRGFGGKTPVLAPNLPAAAVFMVRRGRGFQPLEDAVAWTESARQGLAQGGPVAPEQHLRSSVADAARMREGVPAEAIDDMLKEKFGNPMLGIYGAHLLLQSPQPSWDLMREVVRNLKSLVGNHPDVTALTLLPQLRDLAERAAYPVPPMLKSSWRLIVAASVDNPDLVPLGSYSEAIANRVWESGAWLVWQRPSEQSASTGIASRSDAAPAADLDAALVRLRDAVLARLLTGKGVASYVESVTKEKGLNDTERAVLVYLAATSLQSTNLLKAMRLHSGALTRLSNHVQDFLAKTGWFSGAGDVLASDAALTEELTGDRLVRTLGVPAASLRRAIVSLADKCATDVK